MANNDKTKLTKPTAYFMRWGAHFRCQDDINDLVIQPPYFIVLC